MADIRCRRFSDILRTKEDHYPYSDRYISEVHDSSTKTGRTEREHMVEWFRANETKGSGSYSRQTPNSSARRCYNSLMNAASLLWIAEAVGIDELTVKIAYAVSYTHLPQGCPRTGDGGHGLPAGHAHPRPPRGPHSDAAVHDLRIPALCASLKDHGAREMCIRDRYWKLRSSGLTK